MQSCMLISKSRGTLSRVCAAFSSRQQLYLHDLYGSGCGPVWLLGEGVNPGKPADCLSLQPRQKRQHKVPGRAWRKEHPTLVTLRTNVGSGLLTQALTASRHHANAQTGVFSNWPGVGIVTLPSRHRVQELYKPLQSERFLPHKLPTCSSAFQAAVARGSTWSPLPLLAGPITNHLPGKGPWSDFSS